jgi:hypothetical protein
MKTKNDLNFQETQPLSLWARLTIIPVNMLFIWGIIQQLIFNKPWGNHPMGDTLLLVMTAFMLLLSVWLFYVRMDTIINQEGIFVKVIPCQLKYKHFPWETVSQAYIRKYNPIVEYGGWGVRSGVLSRNVAYNMSGNTGLQLVLTNRKKVLIGTHQPEAITEVLKALNKCKE